MSVANVIRGSLLATVFLATSLSACRQSAGSQAVPPATGPPPVDATAVLRQGMTDGGLIAAGHRRVYRAELPAQWFLEIEAEQRDVDFKLVAKGPGGLLFTADTPNGRHGAERLLLWTATAGAYAVELVATATEPDGDPRFTLHVAALHAGTDRERRRAAAFAAGTEADRLRRSKQAQERLRAVAAYRREAAAWQALGELRGEIHAFDGMDRAARALHQRDIQIAASRRLAELYERAGDVAKRADALVDLGEALSETGQRPLAQQTLREALRLLARPPDGETEARAWNTLAITCQQEGQLGQARAAFVRALAFWQRLGRDRSEAITRANLAFLLAEMGEPQLALDGLARARRALGTRPEPEDEAYFLAREVDTLLRLGRLDGLRPLAERAVAIGRRLGDPRSLATALGTAAEVDYRLEAYSSAEKRFLEAQRLMLRGGDPSAAASLLISAGWCRVRSHRWMAAEQAFARALPIVQGSGTPRVAAAALAGLAWVERERGDLLAARQHALAAVSLVEGLRSSTLRQDLRASLLADRQQFFDLAVDVLMLLQARTGDGRFATEAFAVSERAHGRTLLEALPSLDGADAAPPSQGFAARAAQVTRIDEACRRIRGAGSADPPLGDCEVELRSALDQMRESSAVSAAGSATNPVSLAAVQRELLDDGSQLLLYDLGTPRSYLWVVSRHAVHTLVLPSETALDRLSRDAYQALAGSHRRSFWFEAERRSAALAAAVVAPALPWLTGGRLLIVREGALLYVPFGALPIPGAGPESRPPLISRYQISYLPSASVGVWMQRRQARPPAAALDVLALANPLPGLGLRPLPFTAAEAQQVVATAPPGHGRAVIGSEAVKAWITQAPRGGPRFLHLAAHGFADDRYPELSGLYLAAPQAPGGARDGVLRAYEVAGLRLRCELVVLSACDSGLGAKIAGEGLVGLPHAFLRAGARGVLASLWPVDDPAAPALMGDLYRGLLLDGQPPAAALQYAQLALARHPKWRQPYYWAGFVLTGAG